MGFSLVNENIFKVKAVVETDFFFFFASGASRVTNVFPGGHHRLR